MNKNKPLVIGLASLLSISLPLLAEEAVTEAETTETAAPVEAVAEAPESAPVTEPDSFEVQREARWQARNERYQDLKQRAEKLGVMLPETPPWEKSRSQPMHHHGDMQAHRQHHEEMMAKSQEEREAERMARYQEMREQAQQRRQEMMDDEWSKHQAAIDGMSDEERAACHAMHQRHMRMKRSSQERPMMRGPMGPGMAPGYGYGPGPYGPRNFWDPNQ
jgi:hypothetical protein